MLKKITKRKLFLREFVRKSQWQGIYVGFVLRIVLTIFSLSFFFFSIICQQLIVVLSISGPPMRRWMNSEPLRIRSCWLFTNVLQWFDWNWKKQLLKNTATFRWKLSFWERSSIRVNSETSVLRFRINRKRSFYNEPPCLRKATLIPCW